MKKSVTVLAGLLLFASGWAFGKSREFSADGANWKTLGLLGKTSYILGFRSGFARGEIDILSMQAVKGSEGVSPLSAESKKEVERISARATREDWSLLKLAGVRMTNGKVLATMNTFYADYRNAPVCWADALMFSAASLEGHPPTEQELESVRESDATNKCGM